MWVREIAGYGFWGVGAGGTPPPAHFLSKSAIFDEFEHISAEFEIIGPQIFGGPYPLP